MLEHERLVRSVSEGVAGGGLVSLWWWWRGSRRRGRRGISVSVIWRGLGFSRDLRCVPVGRPCHRIVMVDGLRVFLRAYIA